MKKILSLLCFSIVLAAAAQTMPGKYATLDEKAIKHFQNALKSYQVGKDKDALEELAKAEKRDPAFSEVYELRASIYLNTNSFEKATAEYNKLFALSPHPHWETYYSAANIEMQQGLYAEAKEHYTKFLKAPYIDPQMEEVVKKNLLNCDFALDAMKHPVPFNLVNMGPSINTANHEYFPTITVDGQNFLFTRNSRTGQVASQEDLMVSKKVEGKWAPAELMPGVNTPYNEGAPAYSADGKILFFAACEAGPNLFYGDNRSGLGSCDIFYSAFSNGHWSKPRNLGPPVNSRDWETQPSFSSDGKSLYFIRGHINKDHSVKDQDIFVSTLNENGEFGVPVRLSDKINTTGKEESVFIHPDNMTLYFSSDGHPGMGGLDIFVSKRQPDGEWGDPVNLGYPINTKGDENSILVDPSGKLAYMGSDRPGGYGGLDLYSFELPPNVQPEKITYFKGKVYDAVSKKPLEANFELVDLSTQKTIFTSVSEKANGEFFLTLTANKDYGLNVSRPGYLFYSENFALQQSADKTKPFLVDVPLQPIDTGKTVPLKNVFFETDKFDLKPESKSELNKLVAFLQHNKTLKIELDGHTDDVGDKKKNQVLSLNRANAVCEYLIANGVAKERLSHKGFGDTKPVVANDSPEHRQMNRRTEFRIVGK
jgi:outer membrane protein OmpA-like peptidoglycan-associated protein